jgi:4-amino-4-deoxychorismate lyase
MSLFFETIKVDKKRAFNLKYHHKRMQKTIFDNFSVKKSFDLNSLIIPPDDKFYRCKIIYDKEIKNIEFYRYTPRVIKSFKLINSDINYNYKSTDRNKVDKLFMKKGNCDDIIIIKNDLVTDTSIANIAFFYEGRWTTPATPLLKGTMREKLLDEKKIFLEKISIKELKFIKKLAIMNALIGFKIINNFKIEER